ncbi:DUF4350 domain-containing protein [Agromyces sp. SYSU T0242]|uniref:DUF4350 domain-containing protein n=1 Tax=Agromyces litoreus TaxID=3158561 RepID=UPI0033939D8F
MSRPDAVEGVDAAEVLTPDLRTAFRRRRTWFLLAIVLVAGALALLALQGALRAPGGSLAADGAGPGGAQALARVLADRGVEVEPVRSLDSALAAARAGATVFVHDEFGFLGRDGVRRLARDAELIVVARPDFATLEELAPGVRLAGELGAAPDAASCDLPAAVRAVALSDGQRALRIDDAGPDTGFRGCFPGEDDGFALVAGTSPDGRDVVLVGATTPFSNERIDEAGNAALAIGLLGGRDRVAWYLPGPGDAVAADAPTLPELIPAWTSPVLVLLAVVTIAAGVWRGRRFGPLVVEDLPVHVPASETVEGRARLYARSGARLHAVDQLRMGTIGRLVVALRLPRSADVGVVAAAAARESGMPATSVRALLVDEDPTVDADLVRLARELAELERAVRDAIRPDPGHARTDPTGRRP